MKVLFVTPYFAPDYAASSPMYAAMAEDLVRAGHQVTVLTGIPHYGRNKVWPGYANKFLMEEKLFGCRVVRVHSYVPDRRSRLSKLASLSCFNSLALAVCTALKRHDVAFISNPFPAVWFPLHYLAMVRRTVVIYSVEDVYPDALVLQGTLTSRWLIGLSELLERSCYRRSHYIRVLSDGMRSLLLSKGVPADKIVVLPFFADTDFIRPLPRENDMRARLGLQDKFVVLYAGNMGLSHGLETVLEAAEFLRGEPDMVFLMVGEGTARPQLEEKARRLGLSNVWFLPFQPREELPLLLASADVSLVTLRADMCSECVPSKVYWVLASGRPVVVSAKQDSEIARLLRNAQCGMVVDPGSPTALADALRDLRNPTLDIDAMGRRSRDSAVRHYSRRTVTRRFQTLVEACAPQHAQP